MSRLSVHIAPVIELNMSLYFYFFQPSLFKNELNKVKKAKRRGIYTPLIKYCQQYIDIMTEKAFNQLILQQSQLIIADQIGNLSLMQYHFCH